MGSYVTHPVLSLKSNAKVDENRQKNDKMQKIDEFL